MGWDGSYNWTCVADVKREILENCRRAGATVLDQAGSGEFWYVVEKDGVRHLLLSLIRGRAAGSFMKKDMSEGCGPYYYDCPDRLIALVGEPKNDQAREWRERRAAHLEHKRRQWVAGQQCLIGSAAYTVVGAHKRGFLVVDASGRRWKAQPRQMMPMPVTQDAMGGAQ